MITNHAKYTVVLKELMDNPEVMSKIEEAMSTYELYVPKSKQEYIPNYIPTRSELNKKILNHYKYREIGFETVGRFLDELKIALEEIMPYYNQLMFTQDQDFNIIYNVDYKREFVSNKEEEHNSHASGESSGSGTTTDSNTSNSTIEHDSKQVRSDTPQDELNTPASEIDDVGYASEVTWNKDNSMHEDKTNGTATSETSSQSTQNSNGAQTEFETHEETIKGNYGQVSAQRLIATYRDTILNIEQMIINDKRITELFMLVW